MASGAPPLEPRGLDRGLRRPLEIVVRQQGKRETGGWIWESSRVLEGVLLSERLEWERVAVLELGAGSGWLAMRLASLGARVTATDRAGMLPLLRSNVALNQKRLLTCADCADLVDLLQVHVAALEWEEDFASAQAGLAWAGGADHLVIGSDLVYLSESHGPLLATLANLLAGGARCVLSWEERKPWEEAAFIEEACRRGFTCKLLMEQLDEITEALWDGRHDGATHRRIVVWELLLPRVDESSGAL
ncbi:hypothetical protein AB1Y20_020794 [Prymnesium parvum]|uniref:Calmodulin-lysine N-methyltransferase n=1 Tax=Prymnesium parvum TaxID=97485 RepID=A0AB34JYF7_PRYPA